MNQDRVQLPGEDRSELTDPARFYPFDGRPRHTSAYLNDRIVAECIRAVGGKGSNVLDIGCGDGAIAGKLIDAGFYLVGIDPSEPGIAIAAEKYPAGRFQRRSVYDPLPPNFLSRFDVVISTEVIEHLYTPRVLLRTARAALRDNGIFIISTPYHGYFKNLVLAITGKLDAHFTASWDGGHIKFWSKRTLSALLEEEHFRVINFIGAGRVPGLWKSMILVAKKTGKEANTPR